MTWAGLMVLTLGSFWLADSGAATTPRAGIAGWVLGVATLKGVLIATVYMEMRHGPRMWAVAMSGFLMAEAALLWATLP